jgi:hypothetical protein
MQSPTEEEGSSYIGQMAVFRMRGPAPVALGSGRYRPTLPPMIDPPATVLLRAEGSPEP